MKRKLPLFIAALLAGVMMNTTAFAGEVDEYKAQLARTKAELAEISKEVQLWSTSGTLLKSAENAAEGGHFEHAIELIKEAGLHGELALATAKREKKTWQRNVPK